MCQKICQVDIDSSTEAKGLAKKSKKDKEKKDKKVKKDKTDKKEKKQKKKEKKERKRKEAAQTEEDEDSDEAEAKRQRTAAATPQSAAPSTPATGEGDGDSPEVDKAVDKPPEVDKAVDKPPTEVVKPDDEKKKAEKAAKNNQALAQLALHRASTADLADKLDEDQVSRKSAPGSTTSQGSDAGDTVASDDADLTDKQKLVRHSHLNRFARAVKSTGLN